MPLVNKTMHNLNVNLILGQRLDLKTTLPENAEYDEQGRRVVKTESGMRICADLVVSFPTVFFVFQRQWLIGYSYSARGNHPTRIS